jgi:acetyl-CoA carboxylase biotin carboxyl carrier protein
MAVDLRKIKKLIELVEESNVAELEVRDGEESIRITRAFAGHAPPVVAATVGTSAGATAPTPAPAPESAAAPAAAVAFRSPMAGTFYRAPAPGAEPFVQVGQSVAAGDVICIIESMKMMNEVRAERSGVCVAVVAENGQPVGSGDVLFRFS